jgi:low temperature requirement protein LtrA
MKQPQINYEEEMHGSTIESFFDLVFVFTITQLTHLVEQARGPLDFQLVLLVLMLIWWMYDGYTWLTNETGADRPMRLVLIAAMAGFFVMALALPRIFGPDGLAFGFAYLFIITLHLLAFLLKGGRAAAHAIVYVAPFNFGAAILVIVAGFIQADWSWLFFLAAVILLALTSFTQRGRGFSINSAHFVERHGLVILIVLGESVVDIGTGAASRSLDARTILVILLALALIAALWWSYFDLDDERAKQAMNSASLAVRARLALLGYWYTHLAMIAGVVLIATGVKQVVANDVTLKPETVWLLTIGLAIYFVGDVGFRWALGIRPVFVRAIGAVIALVLGLLGPRWGGAPELAMVAALPIVLLVIEQKLEQGKKRPSI